MSYFKKCQQLPARRRPARLQRNCFGFHIVKLENNHTGLVRQPVGRFARINKQGFADFLYILFVRMAVNNKVEFPARSDFLYRTAAVNHKDTSAAYFAPEAVVMNLAAETFDGIIEKQLLAVIIAEHRDKFHSFHMPERPRRKWRDYIAGVKNIPNLVLPENIDRLKYVSPIVVTIAYYPNLHFEFLFYFSCSFICIIITASE